LLGIIDDFCDVPGLTVQLDSTTEAEFLGIVKGPTGRTDDFCEAVVPILIG